MDSYGQSVDEEINWNPRLYRWEDLAERIRERIRNGTYPRLSIISEVQLMAEFHVARGTIRRVMGVLRAEGWIETKAGKGSIVLGIDDILE